MLEQIGYWKKEYLLYYNLDLSNELGQQSKAKKPMDYIIYEMEVQSKRTIKNFHAYQYKHTVSRPPETLPMKFAHLQVQDLKYILSDIGGVWTAINMLAFLCLAIALYGEMLRD